MSLLKARKKREELKEKIADGIDPSVERSQAKMVVEIANEKVENTFKKVSEEYFKHIQKTKGHSERYYSLQIGKMNNHVYPYLGSKSVTDITKSDARAIISILVDKGNKETAHRVLILIKKQITSVKKRYLNCVDVNGSNRWGLNAEAVRQ